MIMISLLPSPCPEIHRA